MKAGRQVDTQLNIQWLMHAWQIQDSGMTCW